MRQVPNNQEPEVDRLRSGTIPILLVVRGSDGVGAMTALARARREYAAWVTENRMTKQGAPWVRLRLDEARENLAELEGITPADLAGQRRCDWCGAPSEQRECGGSCSN